VTILEKTFEHPIAHRGLHDRSKGVIENSASAFARAIQAGYAIETDLQLSGDAEAIVIHDDKLDRLTKQAGAVSQLSAGQLTRIRLTASKKKESPQTFSQMLEQVAGAVPLVVELKNQKILNSDEGDPDANLALAKAAVSAAKNYGGPLVFKSFYPKMLQNLRHVGFEGPIGIIITKLLPKNPMFNQTSAIERFAIHNLLHYPTTRFDFISCNYKNLDLPAVRLFRKFGFKAMTWTVSSFEIEQKTRSHADQLVFENYLPYRASR